MRKRRTLIVLTSLLASSLAAFLPAGAARAAQVLKIAASAIPHAQILEFIKPQLRTQGIDLQVKVFTDYIQPNLQVEEKQLDANFFQHQPYLEAFNREHGTHIIAVPDSKVHVEPFGAYSRKIKQLTQLRDGAQIASLDYAQEPGRASSVGDETGEHVHAGLHADLLVGGRRAANRGQQPAVVGDDRDVGLRVAAVDGEDRHGRSSQPTIVAP